MSSRQRYTLIAHSSPRTAAIHAIADRQRRRMHHTFLRAGVLDRADDSFRARGVALWQTMGQSQSSHMPFGMHEVLEHIDDACTLCGRITAATTDPGAVTWHSNLIRKYYLPPAQQFELVSRSVLDDALSPSASSDVVDNKAVWVQVVPLTDSTCRLTFVVRVDLERPYFSTWQR
ncbi:hypothetical protein H257_08046 [Aphanomyces astaci]|uniref:START domain-containing protein n=1 Tax=Aphanomyces astaci TaxID=112090 RepID=W4GHW3_APHAT|nr:hypothetical protein H257_08046 [Aphanomyces astaci]ETV78533.1 hypothetical protein H257_08046 [Aphanomyces astaci]|eukprot:XP_009832114.1 hypothetical protein H257_08046 [Aphanomyces astaci]